LARKLANVCELRKTNGKRAQRALKYIISPGIKVEPLKRAIDELERF